MKNKQYLVFGLGRFGSSMARALCAQGQEVLAVDSDQELVNQIAPHVTQALQLDATDEEALRSAISATGYEAGEIRQEPWEKKGLFGR